MRAIITIGVEFPDNVEDEVRPLLELAQDADASDVVLAISNHGINLGVIDLEVID